MSNLGKVVAVCDGKCVQISRTEKKLRKNQAVYRPELKGEKENVKWEKVQSYRRS